MAKVIDISSRLDNTNPKIKIGEKEYEVDTSLKTMLRFDEMMQGDVTSKDSFENIISITLGAKAAKELKVENFTQKGFRTLLAAIVCAMNDSDDIDAVEQRFQQEFNKLITK